MDYSEIQKKIQDLSENQGLLFGLCCAERIVHIYKDFDNKSGSMGYKTLSLLLNKAFSSLYSTNDDFDLKADVDVCLSFTTENIDDFSFLAKAAGRVAYTLAYCFKFMQTKDLMDIYRCRSQLTNLVFDWGVAIKWKQEFSRILDPELKAKARGLVADELIIEEDYITKIKEIPDFTENQVAAIRDFNQKNQILLTYE